jgi:hypothetical protein
MKWQHWLDPVGQYTSLIVAVKSQFVFVERRDLLVAQAFLPVPQVATFRRSQFEEATAALGGFRVERLENERTARAIHPSINKARCAVLLAQAEADATQKNVRAREPSNGNRVAFVALAQAGMLVLLACATELLRGGFFA